MTDQVSYPYSTTGKITVLCSLILIFFNKRWEDKRFWTDWQQVDYNKNLVMSPGGLNAKSDCDSAF
jgi:hypothetical protein